MDQPATISPRVKREQIGSWCVWTKYGRRPRCFHSNQEAAEAEAQRLARKAPGTKFIVMQVVSKFGAEVAAEPALAEQEA